MYVQYVLLLFVYLRLDQDKDLSTACPFFQNLYSLKINKWNNTKQIQKSFFFLRCSSISIADLHPQLPHTIRSTSCHHLHHGPASQVFCDLLLHITYLSPICGSYLPEYSIFVDFFTLARRSFPGLNRCSQTMRGQLWRRFSRVS